jgi:hypothetical protein
LRPGEIFKDKIIEVETKTGKEQEDYYYRKMTGREMELGEAGEARSGTGLTAWWGRLAENTRSKLGQQPVSRNRNES